MIDNATDNVWAGVFGEDISYSTKNVIPFFKRQCEQIKVGSNGRVRARFKKLEFTERQANLPSSVSAMGLIPAGGEVVREEMDALDGIDLNDFFEPSDYAFDVYSEKYKFRVLTLELGAIYPLRFYLDDAIENELDDALEAYGDPADNVKGLWIQSDDELSALIKLSLQATAES